MAVWYGACALRAGTYGKNTDTNSEYLMLLFHGNGG